MQSVSFADEPGAGAISSYEMVFKFGAKTMQTAGYDEKEP